MALAGLHHHLKNEPLTAGATNQKKVNRQRNIRIFEEQKKAIFNYELASLKVM